MNVTVKDLMSSPAWTCAARDSLSAAARILWEHDCGFAPVVDAGGRVVGVITDRDICMAAYTQGLALDRIAVELVMARAVQTCRPRDSLAEAEKVLRSQRIRRLPVVDNAGRAIGVLSLNDIARRAVLHSAPKAGLVCGDEVAETLAAIGRPRGNEQLVTVATQEGERPRGALAT